MSNNFPRKEAVPCFGKAIVWMYQKHDWVWSLHISLEAVLELKVKKLEVFMDSLLIICQVKWEWQTKDKKLKPYQKYLLKLANEFEEIKFIHINRDKNQFVDALTTLALMTQVVTQWKIQPIDIEVKDLQAHCCIIEESLDGKLWYSDIKRFLQYHEHP